MLIQSTTTLASPQVRLTFSSCMDSPTYPRILLQCSLCRCEGRASTTRSPRTTSWPVFRAGIKLTVSHVLPVSRTDVDLQFSGLFSTDSGAYLQAGDGGWRTRTARKGHGMRGNLDCLIRKSHGKPWKGTECHGMLWNMPRETMAINGEPQNPMEGDGRLWNPMEPYGRIMVTQS